MEAECKAYKAALQRPEEEGHIPLSDEVAPTSSFGRYTHEDQAWCFTLTS